MYTLIILDDFEVYRDNGYSTIDEARSDGWEIAEEMVLHRTAIGPYIEIEDENGKVVFEEPL